MTTGKIIKPDFSWQEIDTVLLDMDGTLLDKHFDDYFWEQYVPEHFSLKHNLSVKEAKTELLERYRTVENTLDWTDLDYWSSQLDLDIPELKIRINHLIDVHPYVPGFLRFCRTNRKKIYLVTNAHPKTLAIKLEKTDIGSMFDRIVCAEEIGVAKEDVGFWKELERMLGYDKKRTMLADDTEKVLRSAEQYGLGLLIFVARSSSRKPVHHSRHYQSIEYFSELMPDDEKGQDKLPTTNNGGKNEQ